MAQIEGVLVTPLTIIKDERGQVMHMLRADAPHFQKFGEAYFSLINPGAVKAWKVHDLASANIAVPVGRATFVLHDSRDTSPTRGAFQEVALGEDDYKLLTIPPGVAYGWRNDGASPALIANCSTEPHRQGEGRNLPIDAFSYRWEE